MFAFVRINSNVEYEARDINLISLSAKYLGFSGQISCQTYLTERDEEKTLFDLQIVGLWV
jgi:hypothetical protein